MHRHLLLSFVGAALSATAAPPSQWEIREASHPILGPIRFAFTATPFATPVGISRVSSQVYVSCERNTHRIAIEMANSQAPGDPRGLALRELPKLICKRHSKDGTVQEELQAPWALSELGDVLLRGFPPEALLACKSIGIVQQVELPKGWPQESARLVFDIEPSMREVRSVIADCGRPRAGEAAVAKPALRQASSLEAPARPAVDRSDSGWQRARVTGGGRTNVRASASTEAEVVAHLAPHANVKVRKAAGGWWRVKGVDAGAIEGYVRRDRLVLR